MVPATTHTLLADTRYGFDAEVQNPQILVENLPEESIVPIVLNQPATIA
jgi:hypothetical protein